LPFCVDRCSRDEGLDGNHNGQSTSKRHDFRKNGHSTGFTEEWWQTIETPQTYIYTAEDGTLYEVTVNPDGSSTERCIAPDGSITVETWDAPIVSGTIIKQTGVIIDSNGSIVTYEFTKDFADDSYNYSWNSNIPKDEPSSYFFAVNGYGSFDVIQQRNMEAI